MAIYEYLCVANGRTVEVRHGMSEEIRTWGELAERAGLEPGDTSAEAPDVRLMSAGVPITGGVTSSRSGESEGPACGPSCACGWN
ncbi:MAG: zinc ribbon domain-containing protein [Gemmatimonadota bacterium]